MYMAENKLFVLIIYKLIIWLQYYLKLRLR